MKNGPVVQLVRTPACHAGGRRFEPVSGRHFADIAQSVECILGKDEVTGSNPVISSTCKPLNLGVWRFFSFKRKIAKTILCAICVPNVHRICKIKSNSWGTLHKEVIGLSFLSFAHCTIKKSR